MFDSEILKKSSYTISQLIHNLKGNLEKVGDYTMGHPQVRDYEGIHLGQKVGDKDKRFFNVFNNLFFKASDDVATKIHKLISDAIKAQKNLSDYLYVEQFNGAGVWLCVTGTAIPKAFAQENTPIAAESKELVLTFENVSSFLETSDLETLEKLAKKITALKKALKTKESSENAV